MLQRSRFLGLTFEDWKLVASLKGEASELGLVGYRDIAILSSPSSGQSSSKSGHGVSLSGSAPPNSSLTSTPLRSRCIIRAARLTILSAAAS